MNAAEAMRLAELVATIISSAIETYNNAKGEKITPAQADAILKKGLAGIASNDAKAMAKLKAKFGKL